MKKLLKLFLSSLIIITTLCFNGFSTPRVKATLPFSKGLNFSEWLEPCPGFIDGHFDYFGKQDFIDIESLGVEIVRVPIHFDTFSSGKPDYIIPDSLWTQIDNAVNWCEELGIYLIIDFHNNCEWNSKTPDDIEKRLIKIWTQIANRYKDRSNFVLYEVMNEPHGIDIAKWGKIQGRMIKLIRSIDPKHWIIVGGGDWNSLDSMLKLPKYDDKNLIYNFHDYSPFLFTHQGASWTQIERITKVPFPYDKDRMPPLPKNPNPDEQWNYNTYKEASSESALTTPLDKAVEFANNRNAPLMTNEFGVYMKHAEPQERVNWYRIKSGYLDDRNIVRVSWDYHGGFGVFNKGSGTRFPEDLNIPLIKAMGYKVPQGKSTTWFQDARRKNDYTIYNNGLAKKLNFFSWIPEAGNKGSLYKKDSPEEPFYIFIPNADKYRVARFSFREDVNFTELLIKGAALEFEVRISDPGLKLQIYFMNNEEKGLGWRCGYFPTAREIPSDNQWHKLRIPLSKFYDYGAWDNDAQKWHNGQGKFSWAEVSNVTFDIGEKDAPHGISLRNIVIK